MGRSSNLKAAFPGPPPTPEAAPPAPAPAAPAPAVPGVLEEVTAALVAGFSEADEDAEAMPAWMEGEADTAADSIVTTLRYLLRYQASVSSALMCLDLGQEPGNVPSGPTSHAASIHDEKCSTSSHHHVPKIGFL